MILFWRTRPGSDGAGSAFLMGHFSSVIGVTLKRGQRLCMVCNYRSGSCTQQCDSKLFGLGWVMPPRASSRRNPATAGFLLAWTMSFQFGDWHRSKGQQAVAHRRPLLFGVWCVSGATPMAADCSSSSRRSMLIAKVSCALLCTICKFRPEPSRSSKLGQQLEYGQPGKQHFWD